MEHRLLGSSGLRVSKIALGTAGFGNTQGAGWGTVDLDGAKQQIALAIDSGVNLIDTANAYSDGAAEEFIGQALGKKRDSVLISTKVRFPVGAMTPMDYGLSRIHIMRAVEDSLRRLRTDHIDIYHAHEWDGQVPLDETLHAFDALVRDGKVRYIGASNFTGWQTMKALAVSGEHKYQKFVSNQIYYSLQSRDAEYELLPVSVDQGLGVLVWSPLAGGMLTGKYRRNQSPTAGRYLSGWHEPPVPNVDKLYDIVAVLVELAEARGILPLQIALAWTLTRPAITSLIVGARNEDQLRQSLNAVEVQLTDSELDALNEVSAPPMIYPHWHQSAIPAQFRGQADRVLHGDE